MDVCVNRVVTVETKRKVEEEPMKKNEEERWSNLYPEINKCVIVLARQRLDRLNVSRSGDREPRCDWTEPMDDSGDEGRSFVKKVGVKVWANGTRRARGRSRGSGLLRLTHDVTADHAHCRCHRLQPKREMMEHRTPIRHNNYISQSETDHNYSISTNEPDTPSSQSQDASLSPFCGQRWRLLLLDREEHSSLCNL